ncbi:uncharacterized protein LTR77_004184 [Saxophila tyrrhenica]|uniref:Amidohydrolase-related domain-containing protein n=1 Tax=Saxophila tyrrhenica TaxID=1690608 RepID=A0AAV9PF72_9PEZI|nr:hypothetical protein LTR77_004184 [Saxophila tyrrhenica]
MSYLLQNGTAILHDVNERVRIIKTDILIDGNRISKIGEDITAPASATVIDCTDKIISPGFVDTHHHVWQTQLKGRHADQTPSGNLTAKLFTAEDVFWGQLGGCLEMINGGTTTVADYAHVNISPEHNYNAVSATAASGMRSVFGYCFNPRLSSTNPMTIDPNGFGGHAVPTFDELAKQSPWADGRVKLGLAWDGFVFAPKEYVDMLMAKVDEYKIDLIQTHISWKPGKPSWPQALERLGVLSSKFLMAHSNMTKVDADLYRKYDVHYSSTPSTEMQVALAFPVIAFRDDLGVKDLGSLGVDCHTTNAAYLPGEARIGLQSARGARAQVAETRGKVPLTVGFSVEEAFNLATIRGAHAMKMEYQIGSIAEGKLADLVTFDANSPAMVCAGVHDPVAAIVLHSSPADIDTVIVDGVIRKRDGKLMTVELDGSAKEVTGRSSLEWAHVATNLMRTRHRIQGEAEKLDYEDGQKKVMQAFGISESDLEDPE